MYDRFYNRTPTGGGDNTGEDKLPGRTKRMKFSGDGEQLYISCPNITLKIDKVIIRAQNRQKTDYTVDEWHYKIHQAPPVGVVLNYMDKAGGLGEKNH